MRDLATPWGLRQVNRLLIMNSFYRRRLNMSGSSLAAEGKARIGCHDEGSRLAWRSRRSRVGIKFIDPMNHTYVV